MLTDWIRDFIF